MSVLKAVLIINAAKKGWSEEARKKAAATRKKKYGTTFWRISTLHHGDSKESQRKPKTLEDLIEKGRKKRRDMLKGPKPLMVRTVTESGKKKKK